MVETKRMEFWKKMIFFYTSLSQYIIFAILIGINLTFIDKFIFIFSVFVY